MWKQVLKWVMGRGLKNFEVASIKSLQCLEWPFKGEGDESLGQTILLRSFVIGACYQKMNEMYSML